MMPSVLHFWASSNHIGKFSIIDDDIHEIQPLLSNCGQLHNWNLDSQGSDGRLSRYLLSKGMGKYLFIWDAQVI
jgi:hypothetical protein